MLDPGCLILLLCTRSDRLRLVDIQTAHQPVEFLPGQVPDFGPVPWPAVSAVDSCQSFIDQDKSVRLFKDDFDPVGTSPAEQEEGIR